MPAYGLKKIQNLTIGFGICLMRRRCVAAVFEGVRTGRKVRPPNEGAPYLGNLGACFLKKVLDSVARKCHFLRFRRDILNKRKGRKMQ